MIDGREWRQILTALTQSGAYAINDVPHISLASVISILQTFAESGCSAQINPDGTITIVTPPRGVPDAAT